MVLRGYATKKSSSRSTSTYIPPRPSTSTSTSTSAPTPPPVEEPVRTFCEPWPEDKIEWDVELMKSRGYVGVEQGVSGTGIKGYYLHAEGKTKTFRTKSNLVMLKYAKKK